MSGLRNKLAALALLGAVGLWIVVAAVALGVGLGTVIAVAVALTMVSGLLGAKLYWGTGRRLGRMAATLRLR